MLKELLKGRGAFLEILAAALVLALGVNVLASALLHSLELPPMFQFTLAASLIAVALLWIARRAVGAGRVSKSMQGAIIYGKKENALVRIPRYKLSEAVSDYFEGLFAENEALKKLWHADPISNHVDVDAVTGEATHRRTEAANLLQESIEYFVLDRLSMHLTDYFNKPPFAETQLREFGREDVPTVLFKNRFLDTFSRPMTERPAFVEDALKHKPKMGMIVASFGPGKARYERFDLVLPKGSKVARTSSGSIEIDTSKFRLHFESVFDSLGAVLPSRFEQIYLRRNDFRNLSTFNVKVVVSVRFKSVSLLNQSGWEYHMWLDSFLESLEEEFSSARFLSRISWESARTVFDLMEGSRKPDQVKKLDAETDAQQ